MCLTYQRLPGRIPPPHVVRVLRRRYSRACCYEIRIEGSHEPEFRRVQELKRSTGLILNINS
jgi:hypothetical protein